MAKLSMNRSTVTGIGRALIAAAPAMAPAVAINALRKIVDLGIDGYSRFPGAKQAAASALQKQRSSEPAIDLIVKQHLAMAGAQGFVTNLGGLTVMAATMPANVTGLAIVQARMVASLAHLRGYDVEDPRVRGAVMMCLLGEKGVKELVEKGELPSPMVVATAPVLDDSLHSTIAEKVMSALFANATGRRMAVAATKRVPVVGGGVGAVADGWSTYGIAQFAKKQFVSRHR